MEIVYRKTPGGRYDRVPARFWRLRNSSLRNFHFRTFVWHCSILEVMVIAMPCDRSGLMHLRFHVSGFPVSDSLISIWLVRRAAGGDLMFQRPRTSWFRLVWPLENDVSLSDFLISIWAHLARLRLRFVHLGFLIGSKFPPSARHEWILKIYNIF